MTHNILVFCNFFFKSQSLMQIKCVFKSLSYDQTDDKNLKIRKNFKKFLKVKKQGHIYKSSKKQRLTFCYQSSSR